jgi:hypothetical protein
LNNGHRLLTGRNDRGHTIYGGLRTELQSIVRQIDTESRSDAGFAGRRGARG